MSQVFINQIGQLKPLHDSVLVREMNFHSRSTAAGIIIPADDGKDSGIRPRWAQVFAVGPEQRDILVGQWICVAHGRWTRGVRIQVGLEEHVIRRIDHNDILLVSDTEPVDETMSDKVF